MIETIDTIKNENYNEFMSKLLNKPNLSSYFSALSMAGTLLGLIILGTMRYAQVSFQIEELQSKIKENASQISVLQKSYEDMDDKIDRIHNLYISAESLKRDRSNFGGVNN